MGRQYKFKGTGGAGAVSSVFGRTGDVVAANGDYDFSQLGDGYSLAGTAGQVPVTNAGETSLIPVDFITGADTNVIFVNAATTAVLPGSPVYNNGAGGVGATLTRGSAGAFPTINSVTPAVGKIYCIKDQADPKQNGVFELTTLGDGSTPYVITRTTDSDQTAELYPQAIIVTGGGSNKGKVFVQQTPSPVIGTSNIIYNAQSLAQFMLKTVYDPAGLVSQLLAIPISKTVAQMQALAAGSSFVPGQLYNISNAAVAQGTCSLLVQAYSPTLLKPIGYGSFENAVMGAAMMCIIEYDLTTDFISRITRPYDAANTSLPVTVTDKGNGAIAMFPFDNTTNFANIYLDNPIISNINGTIINVAMGDGCIINLQGVSSILDVVAGSGNGFALDSAALISQCRVGSSNNFTMPNGQILSKYLIGDSKEVDLTAWIAATTFEDGSYIGTNSDIFADKNNLTDATILSEAGGSIDLVTIKCAGVIQLNDPGTGTLATIANYPTDHVIELRSVAMAGSDLLIDNAAGNLWLAGAIDITLNMSSDDWISFRVSGVDPTKLIQVDSQIYS